MLYIDSNGELRQISDKLYHHGVKGMKWGVRKDRKLVGYESREKIKRKLRGVADKSKYAFKKATLTIGKLARDRRVQIGVAAAAGIVAGAMGNMAVARVAATSAFRKLISYGESRILESMSYFESQGYESFGEPTIDNFGQKRWRAKNYDAGSSVTFVQNLKTGTVTYDYTLPDGRSYSNGELLLPDELYD